MKKSLIKARLAAITRRLMYSIGIFITTLMKKIAEVTKELKEFN